VVAAAIVFMVSASILTSVYYWGNGSTDPGTLPQANNMIVADSGSNFTMPATQAESLQAGGGGLDGAADGDAAKIARDTGASPESIANYDNNATGEIAQVYENSLSPEDTDLNHDYIDAAAPAPVMSPQLSEEENGYINMAEQPANDYANAVPDASTSDGGASTGTARSGGFGSRVGEGSYGDAAVTSSDYPETEAIRNSDDSNAIDIAGNGGAGNTSNDNDSAEMLYALGGEAEMDYAKPKVESAPSAGGGDMELSAITGSSDEINGKYTQTDAGPVSPNTLTPLEKKTVSNAQAPDVSAFVHAEAAARVSYLDITYYIEAEAAYVSGIDLTGDRSVAIPASGVPTAAASSATPVSETTSEPASDTPEAPTTEPTSTPTASGTNKYNYFII
jgi:hypothetical protein